MDWSVGQVLNTVRELGLSEKTLVVFTSDNGGTPRAVNAPLRGFKGSTWEGGIRVPTIVWWPGKIPAGTECDAIMAMFDILPTFAHLAGAKLPEDRRIDGINVWDHLTGGAGDRPAHEVFFYYRGLKLEAVRYLQWKYELPGVRGKDQTAKLYDLEADIGETTDVAASHPEVVKKMESLIQAMESDLGLDEIGPGCRPLGRVENAQPLIDYDGKVRAGFEPKE